MNKRRREISEGIIGIIVIILFIYFIVWVLSKPTSIANDFCKDLGYEKATDESSEGFYVVGIECDKKNIYNVCERKRCVSKDKWGNCFNEIYLEIQNSTTTGDCKE